MNPTPQDGGKQEQAFRWTGTMAKPNAPEYLYEGETIIGILSGMSPKQADFIVSSVNSIAGMRAKVAELEGALAELLCEEKRDDDDPILIAARVRSARALTPSTNGRET